MYYSKRYSEVKEKEDIFNPLCRQLEHSVKSWWSLANLLLLHHQIKTEIKQWKGLLPAKISGVHHPSNMLMYSQEMSYKWCGVFIFFFFPFSFLKKKKEKWLCGHKKYILLPESHHSSFEKHLGGINSCSLIATLSATMLRAERYSWVRNSCLPKGGTQSYSPLIADNKVSPRPGEMSQSGSPSCFLAIWEDWPHKAEWMNLYARERTPWHTSNLTKAS